jgi:dTDP-4-dehydrorhamnose reductase
MTKFLVIGKNGQLGKEFVKHFSKTSTDYIALGHSEIDISDLDNVIEVINQIKPEIIINTSAYNQVDLAEKDYEIAFKTNSFGIHNLVRASNQNKSLLVHYGTDYIFDGTKNDGLYTELDNPNPLSQYARSKYMGESFLNDYSKHLLFRVSWVFGDGEQNFIYKFKQWSKNKIMKISGDEVSVPTSTKTIVDITLKSINQDLRGLYHLTNTGYCSRYEYAKFITNTLKLNNIIYPVNMNSFNLPAERPTFSAMDNSKIQKILNIDIESWQDAVKDFLKESK